MVHKLLLVMEEATVTQRQKGGCSFLASRGALGKLEGPGFELRVPYQELSDSCTKKGETNERE